VKILPTIMPPYFTQSIRLLQPKAKYGSGTRIGVKRDREGIEAAEMGRACMVR
jgi:hypothetical protein